MGKGPRSSKAFGIILVLALLGLGGAPGATANTPVDELTVFAADPSGTDSVSLDSGTTYLVEASGSYTYGFLQDSNGEADAECHNLLNGTLMFRNLFDLFFGEGTLDLFVDGQNVEWEPESTSLTGCDDPLTGGSNTYTTTFTPATDGPVNFVVFDPNFYRDNRGSIEVRIFEHPPQPEPEPEAVLIPISVVPVDSSDPEGAETQSPLFADQTYILEANGTYAYNQRNAGDEADAECSRASNDSTWQTTRFGLLDAENWLDVLVDGSSVDWEPVNEAPAGSGCSSEEHVYRIEHTPSENGFANFRVHDSFYKDNQGSVVVTVFLVVG